MASFMRWSASGVGTGALLLNPTKVSEVQAVATAGERMPHKSTYFFPKPLTGRFARPEEQAWPLLFLNSPRSSFVTGVQFDADAGFKAGIFTGQIDPSALMPESMK